MAQSLTRAITTIFDSPIKAKDLMKYSIALLIPLVALSQVIDPNAKPRPGYRIELKQGPLVPGPSVIEKEPGDSVVVQPDGSIVAASRSRSFVFPLANRMEPNVRVSYSLVGNRVQYEYVISNGLGALNAIASFVFAISSPSDTTAPEPWRAVRISKPNENPSMGFYRLAQDRDERGRLKAGVTLDVIRVVSDHAPGLIETTFHAQPVTQPVGSMTSGEFFNSASPWVQQRLGEIDTKDRHRLRGLTIGPVIPLNTDSLEGIRREIQDAEQHPQFSLLREQIQKRPIPVEPASLNTWLLNFRKLSAGGIIVDFVDAMIWRLQRQPH